MTFKEIGYTMNPHYQILSGIIPKLSQNLGVVGYRAPNLGEHTNKLLQEAGPTEEQITLVKKSGVLA